jgi:RNA recognition motif-containing protein
MNIYVGNLAYETTDEQLRELFTQFGEVQSASVIMDRVTGRSRGFGFIDMPDDAQAQQAIDALNTKEIGGRVLTVNQARDRSSRPRRNSGGYRRS